VQVFQGVVMRMSGSGAKARFTVRRIAAHGVGVERTFFLASPRLEKVEVLRHAHVRRKQLYYLRQRRGKAARLRAKRYVRPEPKPACEALCETRAQAGSPSGKRGRRIVSSRAFIICKSDTGVGAAAYALSYLGSPQRAQPRLAPPVQWRDCADAETLRGEC